MLQLKWQSGISLVVAGVVFASVLAGAQAAQAPVKIKDVRQDISLTQDVKVGTTVLKSGQYRVSSKNQELTFRRLMKNSAYGGDWLVDTRTDPVVVKVTATVLDAKSRGTRLEIPADSTGTPVLKSLTLDDTNVKFTID
jgi:hypothetical protein